MKITLLLFTTLLLYTSPIFAQFAVVVDEGGFVNIYDDEKEELDRLGSDGVVAVTAEDNEWARVDYTKYGFYAASSGFVKKDKLVDISSFNEIKITEVSEEFILLRTDSVLIELCITSFDKEKNSITYFSEDKRDVITAINDDSFWGTKTGLPSTQYSDITITKNGKTIKFPEEALFNLYNAHLSLTKAYYDEKNDVVYIYSANGDISGAYTVLWVVEFDDYGIHYIFD